MDVLAVVYLLFKSIDLRETDIMDTQIYLPVYSVLVVVYLN